MARKTKKVEVEKAPKEMIYMERCLSEGGARVMIKYLKENLGHTIVGVQTPTEDDEEGWYIIKFTKNT